MKVLELFGGIGACTTALRRIGVDVEVADYVEIDKYAVASYNAINGTNFEPQDICTWDKNIEVDLIMHGSPCQDFSVAGKQAGGDVGSGTRSSLMYETIRIVGKLRPKYVVWENVKNLLSAKHRHNFDAYLETMKALGYTNYYQVLNAKDYGIPQNRERVFTISIKNDNSNGFEFPKKQQLTKIPLEFIENDVDRKYDLTEKNKLHYQREFGSKGKEIDLYQPIPTLTAAMGSGGGNIPYFEFPPKKILETRLKDLLEGDVDEKYYLSNAMLKYAFNLEKEAKGIGFSDGVDKSYLNPDIALTIGCRSATGQRSGTTNYVTDDKNKARVSEVKNNLKDLRIRKLTPKECWRLMGFSDEDFEKAAKVNSSTQLYKQAGNSIVVNVLEAIFKKLF